MTILLCIIMFILLLGNPIFKKMERTTLQRQTKEEVFLAVKEKPSLKKISAFILIGVLVVFVVNPTEMTFYLGVMKILCLVGLFILEDTLRTKVYVTSKGLYLVQRFRQRTLFNFARLGKNHLYRIDEVVGKKKFYTLYIQGGDPQQQNLTVELLNDEEANVFTTVVQKNIGPIVNTAGAVSEEERHEGEEWLHQLTNYFIRGLIVFAAYGVLTGIFSDEKNGEQIFSSIAAIEFLPIFLFLGIYLFVKGGKFVSRIDDTFMDMRLFAFLCMIGSSTLPFVVLSNHRIITGQHFAQAHGLGFGLCAFLLIASWALGRAAKVVLYYWNYTPQSDPTESSSKWSFKKEKTKRVR